MSLRPAASTARCQILLLMEFGTACIVLFIIEILSHQTPCTGSGCTFCEIFHEGCCYRRGCLCHTLIIYIKSMWTAQVAHSEKYNDNEAESFSHWYPYWRPEPSTGRTG